LDLPDLAKIRRFSLVIATVLIAIVLADVQLDTPLRIAPLGISLVVRRPDLLTVALVIASVYSTLRYVYYGMFVQPSPMRARRELLSRTERILIKTVESLEEFRVRARKEVDRYFPHIWKAPVTFNVVQNADGNFVKDVNVPPLVRAACWIEDLDFLLPVFANVAAVALWIWMRRIH